MSDYKITARFRAKWPRNEIPTIVGWLHDGDWLGDLVDLHGRDICIREECDYSETNYALVHQQPETDEQWDARLIGYLREADKLAEKRKKNLRVKDLTAKEERELLRALAQRHPEVAKTL